MNDTLNFNVTIEDEVKDAPRGGNNIVRVPITVIVLDENDNAPLFLNVSASQKRRSEKLKFCYEMTYFGVFRCHMRYQ